MKAVILAAGEGARMGPFTASQPKVMIPVGNRPIIEYVIRALSENDVRDVIVVVGYKRESIMSHFQDGRDFGVNLEYVTQQKQLGTAHALREARGKLDREFLVLNGSNLVDARAVRDLLDESEGPSMLITESETPTKYGVVTVTGKNLVQILEKPSTGVSNLINTGVYLLDKDFLRDLDTLAAEGHFDMPTVLQNVAVKRKIRVVRTRGVWVDALYPWDLLDVNGVALKTIEEVRSGTLEKDVTIRGKVSIGDGSVLRSGTYIQGPVVIGRNCEIGPNVVIHPATSIGENVIVKPFSFIENSIVMDDVSIGASSIVEHGVIGRGCSIKANFAAASGKADILIEGEWHSVEKIGVLMGEYCEVASGVTAEPGTLIGSHLKAAAGARLRGTLPDGGIVS